MKSITIKVILLAFIGRLANAASGPINPEKPKPALIGVPPILKAAPSPPQIPALRINGSNNLGLVIKLAICILGEPKKWAIEVPIVFACQPKIAKLNPTAVIPRLAAPEAIPEIPIAVAIPTEEIGETISRAKITPIMMPMIIGCKVVRCLIARLIRAVSCPTGILVKLPRPPAITNTSSGTNKIVYALSFLPKIKINP